MEGRQRHQNCSEALGKVTGKGRCPKTFRLYLVRESEEAKAKRVVLRINKAKENRHRWFQF